MCAGTSHVLPDKTCLLMNRFFVVVSHTPQLRGAESHEVNESDYDKARALWGFAKERAGVYIGRVYGCDSGAEFERMGEALFNCA